MPLDLHGPDVRAAIIRCLEAEDTPSATPHKKGAFRKVGLPAMVAGDAADTITTIAALKRGGTKEANPVMAPFAKHPAALAGVKGGMALVKALILDKLADKHPKLATGLGVGLGALSGGLAVSNARKGRD